MQPCVLMMLKTVWKEPVWVLVQKEEAAEEKENAGEEEKDEGASEIVPVIEYPELKWRDAEAIFEPEMRINSSVEEDAAQTNVRNELPSPDVPAPVSDCTCKGDKWEQLCTMYPVIHPFGDGREYLSIAPADFVVLRQEYHKMTHNSFLLHGYYNYRHLILGRLKEGNGWQYYLGVPGNFYHREKMVAEMFGFEAFEGEKDSAAPGDFGYFMKRVEI